MTKERESIISSAPDSLYKYLHGIWLNRSFVLVFAKRDLQSKYAQTILGLAWTIVQPLTALLVYTLFFQWVLDIDTGDFPYILYAFSGMISWYFFSYVVYQGSSSILQNHDLINRVFFPKILLPVSKVLVGGVEFMTSLFLFLLISLGFGILPSAKIFLLPLFVLSTAISGLAVAIWLAALTIKKRDLQHLAPYLINFGIWLTPVFFPVTILPDGYQSFLYLNPMAGIIDSFRWCLLGGPFSTHFLFGHLFMIGLLVSGVVYFKTIEDSFSDVV